MSPTFEKPINTTARDLVTEGLPHTLDVNLAISFEAGGEIISQELLPLLQYVSSMSIPCGVHAGHPVGIMAALKEAKARQLSVGAAIGLPPHQEALTDEAWLAWVTVQIGALRALAHVAGTDLHYVRPAAPLYDEFFAKEQPRLKILAKVLAQLDGWLILVGPFGETLTYLKNEYGVRVAAEAHLGKRYRDNGEPILYDPARFLHGKAVVDQLHQLLKEGSITTQTGQTLSPKFSSLHIDPTMAHVENTLKNLTQRIQNPVPLPVAVAAPSGWV